MITKQTLFLLLICSAASTVVAMDQYPSKEILRTWLINTYHHEIKRREHFTGHWHKHHAEYKQFSSETGTPFCLDKTHERLDDATISTALELNHRHE